MALATEQGFAALLAAGARSCGVGLAAQGQGEEGMPRSSRAWPPGGPRRGAVFGLILALLAEAYGQGRAGRGGAARAGRGAGVHKTGERCWEAELYRLKGELLLAQLGSARMLRPKPAFSRPSTSPATSRPNPGSCGRQ